MDTRKASIYLARRGWEGHMRALTTAVSLLGLGVIGGCASTPAETIPYYFPKTRIDVSITQTIGCSATNQILSVATANVATSYPADYNSPVRTVAYKSFDGLLLDSDTAVTRTNDGQLSSINVSGTGEAAAILRSAIALAGVFTGVHPLNQVIGKTPEQQVCDTLAKFASPKKAGDTTPSIVSLSYIGRLELVHDERGFWVNAEPTKARKPLSDHDPAREIAPDANSAPLFKDLSGINGFQWGMSAKITPKTNAPSQPASADGNKGYAANQLLKVPYLKLVNLEVAGPMGDLKGRGQYWDDDVIVPSRVPVDIPIMKGKPFGKAVTAVSLAPSGLVSKLEYSKTSGIADLVGSASQLANQASGQTEAQKAADIQAKSDLIYQQQRLVSCQLDAATCPSK